MASVNYAAVFVAALANFFIGFMFHGPIGGKLWMKLANIVPTGNEKLSDMWPQMLKNLLANVVFAYILAMVYLFASTSSLMGNTSVWGGVITGFWVWLGFVVTSTSMDVIWMGRSYKLWLFESFSSLVCIVVMGAIIAGWN